MAETAYRSVPHERADAIARLFHETYEKYAPAVGYKTRDESAVPWEDVPEANKQLMWQVAAVVLQHIAAEIDEQGAWLKATYEKDRKDRDYLIRHIATDDAARMVVGL